MFSLFKKKSEASQQPAVAVSVTSTAKAPPSRDVDSSDDEEIMDDTPDVAAK